jgi:hypothetical protein
MLNTHISFDVWNFHGAEQQHARDSLQIFIPQSLQANLTTQIYYCPYKRIYYKAIFCMLQENYFIFYFVKHSMSLTMFEIKIKDINEVYAYV